MVSASLSADSFRFIASNAAVIVPCFRGLARIGVLARFKTHCCCWLGGGAASVSLGSSMSIVEGGELSFMESWWVEGGDGEGNTLVSLRTESPEMHLSTETVSWHRSDGEGDVESSLLLLFMEDEATCTEVMPPSTESATNESSGAYVPLSFTTESHISGAGGVDWSILLSQGAECTATLISSLEAVHPVEF